MRKIIKCYTFLVVVSHLNYRNTLFFIQTNTTEKKFANSLCILLSVFIFNWVLKEKKDILRQNFNN